jgi:hypothetical protein
MVEFRDASERADAPLDERTCVGAVPVAPSSQMLSAGWEQAVLARLAATGRFKQRTYNKIASHTSWSLGYFERRGVKRWPQVESDICLEWCWAGTIGPDGQPVEPSVSTARNRQWTLRLIFEMAAALGAEIDPHTAAGDAIKRTPPRRRPRPLTDDEDRTACAYADSGAVPSKRSLMVALSRAGGSAATVAAVCFGDIDLDAATVTFTEPARVCVLDEWSTQTIARYLRANPDVSADVPVCVKAGTSAERAVESVNTQLWKVLQEAGFGHRSEITGRSLRLTAARRAFERDGIEAAARVIGSPSLDRTAEALGYDWRHHPTAEPLGRGRQSDATTQPGITDSDTAPAGASDG